MPPVPTPSPAPPPLPPGVEVTTTAALRAGIGSGNSTLLLPSGTVYVLDGAQIYIPAGTTVTIATVGHGPRAIIDGEYMSRLFYVEGVLRLIGVDLRRGHELSTAYAYGSAIKVDGSGASLHMTGGVISDCTASSTGEVSTAQCRRTTARDPRRAMYLPHLPRVLLGRPASSPAHPQCDTLTTRPSAPSIVRARQTCAGDRWRDGRRER